MGTLIRLSNIRYRYPGNGSPWVLRGIDLAVDKGEYVLLCGRSGSGKSSLGFLLNGLIPHFFGGALEGRVTINGEDTSGLSVAGLLSTVGMVFQNSDAQLFNGTVENEIAFGLESLGIDPGEIADRTRKTAEELGLSHLLDRSPTTLSGGEKRLVAIASVLCLDPPLLVLDEPLGHLDWEGAGKIRKILADLHRRGKTLILMEQRIGPLLDDVSRCVVLGRGRVLFDDRPGRARSVLEKEHLIPRYPAAAAPDPGLPSPLLKAINLTHIMDGKPVIEDLSLDVDEGEILAIVGKNGAGKTTLIRHLNGLLRPNRGRVEYLGEDIRGIPPSRMASLVGISFQNANDQFFKSTVRDELTAGLQTRGHGAEDRMDELCDLLDLHPLLDRSPYRLSEGQKKRVAIASILVMGPNILVLDEPTVGQDGLFLEAMARILFSLRQRGMTMAVVTHDLEFARATAQRLVLVDRGRVAGMAVPGSAEERAILTRMGMAGGETWPPTREAA